MNESSQPKNRFRKSQRLRTTEEFRRCYAAQRAGDDHLLVFAAQRADEQSRTGVSVSKKHGNAVARNRKKRLLREAYRLQQHDLPAGLDIVMVPRQRGDSTLADYQKSLQRLLRKIVRRIEQKSAVSRADRGQS